MRIIVWGINYAPEQTGIGPYNTALCEFLAERGHEVEMVTGFEYYPHWEKKPGDRGRFFRDDERAGVKIHRCWLFVPRQVQALKRMAHELSFVISSLARVLFLKRPDTYVVVSPPLLLGLAGAVAGFLKRAPFVFHVQDLQPDAAIRLGMLRGDRWLARILYGLESLSYSSATRISGISPGIVRLLSEKKVPAHKILYIPNGVTFPSDPPASGRFRERHGISPEAFIVLYSGNLGLKQGLSALIDAALHFWQRDTDRARPGVRPVMFVIAGTGASRGQLAAQVEREKLGNVLMLPLQPEEAYREMLIDADCCAITQQSGTGALFFPSKLLTTLAFSKPVLSIADADSDLALAVKDGAFGINVLPGSPEAVVDALDRWTLPGTDLQTLGEQGREYVSQFEMREVLGRCEESLRRLVRPRASVIGGAAPDSGAEHRGVP